MRLPLLYEWQGGPILDGKRCASGGDPHQVEGLVRYVRRGEHSCLGQFPVAWYFRW